VATAWTSPTLRGERVLLRPLGPRDTDDLWADIQADLQNAEARRLTGTHRSFTYEEIVAYCASRADKTDRLTLAMTDPGTGAWLGEIVLMDHDEPNRSASLRLALVAGAQNRGLGTEALRLVLSHAFGLLGLHRVSLEVFDFNARAIHVYMKVGFRHEGRMRAALWWDGAPHDTLLMAVLATEWDNSFANKRTVSDVARGVRRAVATGHATKPTKQGHGERNATHRNYLGLGWDPREYPARLYRGLSAGVRALSWTAVQLGLAPYFDRVEVGSPVGPIKPQGMRAVLTAWSAAPEECAYVGDTPYDMEAAAEVGLMGLGAAWASTATVGKANNPCSTPVFTAVDDMMAWIDQNVELRRADDE